MKHLIFALLATLLVVGMVFTPVLASPAAAACGDTYTVVKGDYLSKIAKNCGVSLTQLINANPSIKDINKIYPGQVIRITASAATPTPTTTTVPSNSGTYVVQKGDYLSKIAVRFGTTVNAILQVNPNIKNASLLYVGQVIYLPSTATGSRITLSATSARVGNQVEVKITGFPANASVDFRLGKQDTAYSVVVDATTDSNGAATAKVTIPTAAKVGEKWIVVVQTTDRSPGTSVTSSTITIIS